MRCDVNDFAALSFDAIISLRDDVPKINESDGHSAGCGLKAADRELERHSWYG
jgi:hypothetical protein